MFRRFAEHTARIAGRPVTFSLAVAVVLGWAVAGPIVGYSTRWQLFINSFTTIVTFLMVFILQNTQTRDSLAIQIKLDELLRVTRHSRKEIIDLEEVSDRELASMQQEFRALHEKAQSELKRRERTRIHGTDVERGPSGV